MIGRQKKLDFSRVTPEEFEQRRLEYHRTLQEEFFDAYVVSGTRTHMLRKGDSLWYLAQRKYEVPVWLLRQYNPDLDFGSLPPARPWWCRSSSRPERSWPRTADEGRPQVSGSPLRPGRSSRRAGGSR